MACSGILVVEDDDAIRETESELLRMEGYEVHSASNGREALDTLKRLDRPCLILLDLMMPVMDGWQFLEARRQNLQIADMPVVIVSAVADPRQKSLNTEVVRKPPDIDELLQIIDHHCVLRHGHTDARDMPGSDQAA